MSLPKFSLTWKRLNYNPPEYGVSFGWGWENGGLTEVNYYRFRFEVKFRFKSYGFPFILGNSQRY
jgi:hypothetical protein